MPRKSSTQYRKKGLPRGSSFLRLVARLFLGVFLALHAGQSLAASPAASLQPSPSMVVPERTITQKEKTVPDWKRLWDEARSLVRGQRYKEAAGKYENLLAQKPDLQEARWELVGVWLQLQKPDKAVSLLELLVEASPDRLEYLQTLARLLERKGQYGRAVDLLIRISALEPENPAVLRGIVAGFKTEGKKQEAVPFLEKLQHLEPENPALRRELADLYYDAGLFDKARPLLVQLASSADADLAILKKTAQVYDRLGLLNLGAEYWQRVVRKKPRDEEGLARLAAYYEKEGQGEEALRYLLPALDRKPDRAPLLKRIGQIYLGMTSFSEALPYFERYVALRPDDKEALRLVVDIHAALGNKAQTLTVLEHFLAVEAEPDLAKLKQAAYLYEGQGHPEKAIPLYERVLTRTPGDPEILARLAKDYFAVGKDKAALAMWDRLARQRKLLEVLEILHDLEPANKKVMLKLASMYLARDALQKSQAMFGKLAQVGERGAEFFAARATLYERLQQPYHALLDYEKLLARFPDRDGVRLRSIRLAGELGLLAYVAKQRGWLERQVSGGTAVAPEAQLVFAAALRDAGALGSARARYESFLSGSGARGEDSLRVRALLGRAKLYQQAGLPYEATQSLRMALNYRQETDSVIKALFEQAMRTGRHEDAGVWLELLEAGSGPAPKTGESAQWTKGATPARNIKLMRARFLAAQKEYRPAIKMVRKMLADLPTHDADAQKSRQGQSARQEISLTLCRFFLAAGRNDEAERQALEILAADKRPSEVFVLLSAVYVNLGEKGKARQSFLQALGAARVDAGRLLHLAELCRRHELYGEMAETAREAVRLLPGSLKAQLYLAQALALGNDDNGAINRLDRIDEQYPGNIRAATLKAKIFFKVGRFDEALALCETLLATGFDRPEFLLLKGRILWARRQWPRALTIFADFLEPSVATLFYEQSKKAGLTPPPEEPPGFWQRISLETTPRSIFVDRVMTASYAASDSREHLAFDGIGAPLYGLYCWQKQFALELRARRSMERREYYEAVKQFGALARGPFADESVLFDLAGLHGRLNRLGREAALYEVLLREQAKFPGLEEAVQRNQLKRQPRTLLGYGYANEEGRKGYKAMRREWLQASQWFSPFLRQEFDFSAKRLNYRDPDSRREVKAVRTLATYTNEMLPGLSLVAAAGVSALNGYADTALARCALTGAFGDKVWSRLSYSRDVNEDTVASLTRNIVQQDIATELAVDIFPRLRVGGEYDYTDYSDNNWTQGYDVWASYILFTDPAFLRLTYTYDFKDSKEGARPGPPLDDGFATADHPYWAPVNYWQKRFSVFFKHQLSDDPLQRDVPRYYSLAYTVAYDSHGYALQTWEGGLFWELSPHVIVEASAEVVSSQEYRARDIFLSASYRW